MSELRVLVRRRLAAAADEICGLLELSLGDLEQEVRRQRRLLDSVLNPEIRLHRHGERLCVELHSEIWRF